ncbi:hypothetical protein CY35_12G111900 [Sphagnum magellanicum]|nr:hypothetical protein CY35_12G111900 [Sphagnum magellanicum]
MAPAQVRPLPSPFKRVLLRCSVDMQAYGQCVTSKLPAVELGICEKEFRALKTCMERVVKNKG